MSRPRTVICACEDVELETVLEEIERGYEDLEALKRVTAVTTSPCQGKHCLRATIEVLAEHTDADPDEIGSITHRQPVHGVPLAALAQAPTDDEAEREGDEEASP